MRSHLSILIPRMIRAGLKVHHYREGVRKMANQKDTSRLTLKELNPEFYRRVYGPYVDPKTGLLWPLGKPLFSVVPSYCKIKKLEVC